MTVSQKPSDTALYMWGYNGRGQTAHVAGLSGDVRTSRCQRTPFPVKNETFRYVKDKKGQPVLIVDVACGLEHTAAVGDDGSLFTWGRNDYGQLGDGSEDDSKKPRQVLRSEHVTSVACGSRCTAAISRAKKGGDPEEGVPSEGRLWVWGENMNSNLPRLFRGAFPPDTRVLQVSCGATHAAAVSDTGLLQTWGYNEVGQLGWGVTCEGLQPARLVSHFMRHLDDAPSLSAVAASAGRARGRGVLTEAALGWHRHQGLEGQSAAAASKPVCIVAVACGDYHTATVESSGELYTWGLGQQGQLGHRSLQSGHGTRELLPRRVVALEGERISKVACGRSHTCAVSARGALYVWGGGKEGQLGTQLSLKARSGVHSAAAGGAGGGITERLQEGGRAAAAALEELAAASLVLRLPVLLVPGGIADVACGADHTLAVTRVGELLGWGYNSCGQATSGRALHAWQPTRIDWCVGHVRRIAAGGGHTAVLTQALSLRDLCEFQVVSLTLSWHHKASLLRLHHAPDTPQGRGMNLEDDDAMESSPQGGLSQNLSGPLCQLSIIIDTAQRVHALPLVRFCTMHRERLLSGKDWDLEATAH